MAEWQLGVRYDRYVQNTQQPLGKVKHGVTTRSSDSTPGIDPEEPKQRPERLSVPRVRSGPGPAWRPARCLRQAQASRYLPESECVQQCGARGRPASSLRKPESAEPLRTDLRTEGASAGKRGPEGVTSAGPRRGVS